MSERSLSFIGWALISFAAGAFFLLLVFIAVSDGTFKVPLKHYSPNIIIFATNLRS